MRRKVRHRGNDPRTYRLKVGYSTSELVAHIADHIAVNNIFTRHLISSQNRNIRIAVSAFMGNVGVEPPL